MRTKQSLSCIKVRFPPPESMMENLPFFCGWGCLLRRNLRVQPVYSAMDFFWVVKLPRLQDAQLWIVFSFKYRSVTLYMILGDSSSLLSVSFWELGVELYTQDLVKFVRHRLFPDILFQDGGNRYWHQLPRTFIHSFTVFVERDERLRMFLHRNIIELLYRFVWNY